MTYFGFGFDNGEYDEYCDNYFLNNDDVDEESKILKISQLTNTHLSTTLFTYTLQ